MQNIPDIPYTGPSIRHKASWNLVNTNSVDGMLGHHLKQGLIIIDVDDLFHSPLLTDNAQDANKNQRREQ